MAMARKTRGLQEEIARLREAVARLEAEKAYTQAIASDAARQFQAIERELERERERRHRMEMQLERQLASVSSLHVAAHRMSEARGRHEVLAVINEVIANMVGSERFGIFELIPGDRVLALVSSMGIEAARFQRVHLGRGCIGTVAQ